MSIWSENKKTKPVKASRKAKKVKEVSTYLEEPIETEVVVPTKLKQMKDERLDKLMPVLTEMITKLLNAGGMIRFRTDFISKVKEIMDEPK